MAQLQRVEGQADLKCHADKFFDIWASKAHLIPKISPHKVAKVELVEGDWNKIGAVYDNGELTTGKTRVEELDIENRLLMLNIIDGHARQNYYKTFKAKMEVSPKGENCIIKYTIEYEKLNESAPEPNLHIDFMLDLAKEIDAHLCSA